MSGFSSDYYTVGVVDSSGFLRGKAIDLPRVTKILDALPKYLQYWGYKLGLEAAKQMDDALAMPIDQLYEEAKKRGRAGEVPTPSNALSQAAGRGLDIHDIAESFFAEGRVPSPDEVPEEYHGYVKSLALWYKDRDHLEIVTTEQPLFSLTHGYAGTCDLIARSPLTDEWFVIDFKTSKGIYESALLQVTAYAQAAKEMGIVPEDGTCIPMVVRLGSTGKPEVRVSRCGIDDFLAVKRVWELLERLKKEGADVNSVGRNASRDASLPSVRDVPQPVGN